jgi:PAS domain S-box-containing protein
MTLTSPCEVCGADPESGQAASDRDQTAEDRDRAAELRDRGAETRDAEARQLSHDERDIASASPGQTKATRAREKDAEATRENRRLQGEHDREMAADDRAEAADDREEAARERAVGVQDRVDSASAATRAIETLESMSDAFLTLDFDWRFTYLNPQAESILGVGRGELIEKDFWEEFPRSPDPDVEEKLRRSLREQVPVRFEQSYEALGGVFEFRVYPVVAGLALYFTDVSDERARDERLRQQERLETLGQLTAGIVHDFRNLLGAVSGFAKLGQKRSTDDATTRFFDAIVSASDRAEALTAQLLAFARQQDLSPTLIDLNEAVESLASLLRQLMTEGIDLRIVLAPEPVIVFVDRSQLEQVLVNLIVNSRDAIHGAGTVTVSTFADSPTGVVHDIDGPCGLLQVSDTGSGIPDDVRKRMFDPFFSTKPVGSGTGLGLATIYGIITQSGGSILVDSIVDVGTTMTVVLPADPLAAMGVNHHNEAS